MPLLCGEQLFTDELPAIRGRLSTIFFNYVTKYILKYNTYDNWGKLYFSWVFPFYFIACYFIAFVTTAT